MSSIVAEVIRNLYFRNRTFSKPSRTSFSVVVHPLYTPLSYNIAEIRLNLADEVLARDPLTRHHSTPLSASFGYPRVKQYHFRLDRPRCSMDEEGDLPEREAQGVEVIE
jgi:hypothetical protein